MHTLGTDHRNTPSKDYVYGQKCETYSNIKDYKHVPIQSKEQGEEKRKDTHK